MKLREFFQKPYEKDTNIAAYASFLKFLKPNVVRDENNTPIEDYIPMRTDTNFMSNFPRDVIASPIHASPTAHSYSFQLVGKKMWLLMSPEDMESYHAINTPSTMIMKGSEAEYFMKKASIPYVLQEEGDFFFFPVNVGHAVLTMEGPNVMLNLRQVAVLDSFKRQPWRLIEALVSLFSTNIAVRSFSHKHVNPLQKVLLMGSNADSTCASTWSRWFRE
jgi:hypothetical protein